MFTSATEIDLVLRVLILGPLALVWILMLVSVIGLRSFSKMIAVDFVVTIATGSLLANAATAGDWREFIQATGAMAMLLAAQAAFTWGRRNWKAVRMVENSPALLMKDGKMLPEAMAANRIGESDIYAKLREANALDLTEVHAVVLETTGDISVLHGQKPDPVLLEGVKGAAR